MIFNIPFKDVSKNDIQNLIDSKVREGLNLDYKEQLIGNSDGEKKEFLSDVASFANSAGGIIVFGVQEERDSSNKATGLPMTVRGLQELNIDQESLRINNIIRTGLDPRIAGIELRSINGFESGSVLLIKIPKSFNAPHMVIYGGSSRFVARNSAGKYPLDVREISSLVLEASELPKRIRLFQTERLVKIIAAETPVRLRDLATHIIHVVPVNVFSGSAPFDISNIHSRLSEIKPPGALSYDGRYNLHGYVSFPVAGESLPISYIQVFRNGVLEIATARADWVMKDGHSYIPSTGYERYVIDDSELAVKFLSNSDVAPPIVILPSVLGVKNSVLITDENEQGSEQKYTFNEENLILPDITLREYNEDIGKVLRPAFDYLWQCGGFARSQNYNRDGTWVGRLF